MPKNDTDLIGAADAAQILHLDLRTVHRKIIAGDIPHVAKMPGRTGAYILSREAVEALQPERAA